MITTLFTDVGGVLMSNGWDHLMREKAQEQFDFDGQEMERRHKLMFSTYELGKITLDDYLDAVLFYEPRSFSKEQFKNYMFAQSKPFPEMFSLIKEVKEKFQLKVAAITNEGKELILHRIHNLGLIEFVDFFIASGLVHLSKPDPEIFSLALNVAQTAPEHSIYIDDRRELVTIAEKMGMNAFHHVSVEETKQQLFTLLGEC